MSKLLATRGAQWPLFQEFVFNFNDWVADSVDGAKKTFGVAVTGSGATAQDPVSGEYVNGLTGAAAATIVFDALAMPIGASIIGGEVVVETPFAGSTAATLSVGIAGSTTALANAVDTKAAAGTRTALTLTTTPLLCNNGQNIRLTFAYTVANATAGKVRVRVLYTLDGKVNENTIS